MWTIALSNSRKLWAMPCRATQDEWVMVESFDKCGPLEKRMANHFSILALRTPWTVWKGKDRTLKDELPRSVGAQYAVGEEWRNNSRKNEEREPKQKQCTLVEVTGYGSKVRCCKEQYCIEIWNVRSKNQGKLEVVKQEMARVNINILGTSELKWTGWVNLTHMTIISTIVGKNPLEEME